jgi:hypothetical protein
VNLIAASDSPGGPAQALAGQWQITSAVGDPPRRVFRRVFYLQFPTGGAADGIALDPQATSLQGVFQPYDYDALSIGGPLAASLSSQDGNAIVALDAPRHVRQVRLAATTETGTGYTLGFHRVDGTALSEKPTVAAILGASRFDLADAADVKNPLVTQFAGAPLKLSAAAARAAPAAARTSPVTSVVTDRGSRQAFQDTKLATLGPDFADVRFALRLTRTDDSQVTLSAAGVDELHLRSYPIGPRLGIADPADLTSTVFFWQAPGEIGKSIPATEGNVDGGAALAAALQTYLDRLPALLPADVNVALVVESDAPCMLSLASFAIAYHLVRQSFPSGEPKQVLRFPGDRMVAQQVPVELPGSATVAAATLEVVARFGPDRPASGSATGAAGEPSPATVPAETQGVFVGSQQWVAQRTAPAVATAATGLALALLGLAPHTALLVELREDWQGQPAGKTLASGTIVLDPAGARGWSRLPFAVPVVLPAQPCWILAKAAAGSAVWLASPTDAADTGPAASAGAAGGEALRLFERADQTSPWTEVSALAGLRALHAFFSPTVAGQAPQPLAVTVGPPPATGALPGVGAPLIQGTTDASGNTTFDLAEALATYLIAQPQPPPATATIPLAFTATVPGLVTVYPPRIAYDL